MYRIVQRTTKAVRPSKGDEMSCHVMTCNSMRCEELWCDINHKISDMITNDDIGGINISISIIA